MGSRKLFFKSGCWLDLHQLKYASKMWRTGAKTLQTLHQLREEPKVIISKNDVDRSLKYKPDQSVPDICAEVEIEAEHQLPTNTTKRRCSSTSDASLPERDPSPVNFNTVNLDKKPRRNSDDVEQELNRMFCDVMNKSPAKDKSKIRRMKKRKKRSPEELTLYLIKLFGDESDDIKVKPKKIGVEKPKKIGVDRRSSLPLSTTRKTVAKKRKSADGLLTTSSKAPKRSHKKLVSPILPQTVVVSFESVQETVDVSFESVQEIVLPEVVSESTIKAEVLDECSEVVVVRDKPSVGLPSVVIKQQVMEVVDLTVDQDADSVKTESVDLTSDDWTHYPLPVQHFFIKHEDLIKDIKEDSSRNENLQNSAEPPEAAAAVSAQSNQSQSQIEPCRLSTKSQETDTPQSQEAQSQQNQQSADVVENSLPPPLAMLQEKQKQDQHLEQMVQRVQQSIEARQNLPPSQVLQDQQNQQLQQDQETSLQVLKLYRQPPKNKKQSEKAEVGQKNQQMQQSAPILQNALQPHKEQQSSQQNQQSQPSAEILKSKPSRMLHKNKQQQKQQSGALNVDPHQQLQPPFLLHQNSQQKQQMQQSAPLNVGQQLQLPPVLHQNNQQQIQRNQLLPQFVYQQSAYQSLPQSAQQHLQQQLASLHQLQESQTLKESQLQQKKQAFNNSQQKKQAFNNPERFHQKQPQQMYPIEHLQMSVRNLNPSPTSVPPNQCNPQLPVRNQQTTVQQTLTMNSLQCGGSIQQQQLQKQQQQQPPPPPYPTKNLQNQQQHSSSQAPQLRLLQITLVTGQQLVEILLKTILHYWSLKRYLDSNSNHMQTYFSAEQCKEEYEMVRVLHNSLFKVASERCVKELTLIDIGNVNLTEVIFETAIRASEKLQKVITRWNVTLILLHLMTESLSKCITPFTRKLFYYLRYCYQKMNNRVDVARQGDLCAEKVNEKTTGIVSAQNAPSQPLFTPQQLQLLGKQIEFYNNLEASQRRAAYNARKRNAESVKFTDRNGRDIQRNSQPMLTPIVTAVSQNCQPAAVPRNCQPTAVPQNCQPTAVSQNCQPTAVPQNCQPTAVPQNCQPAAVTPIVTVVPQNCQPALTPIVTAVLQIDNSQPTQPRHPTLKRLLQEPPETVANQREQLPEPPVSQKESVEPPQENLEIKPEAIDIPNEFLNVDDEVIDLTWIDDASIEEISSELAEFNSTELKCEKVEVEELKQEREAISPADSGVGSPLGQHEDPHDSSYKCLCGNRALYVCACNTSTYCSRDCQVADWEDHQLRCDKMKD